MHCFALGSLLGRPGCGLLVEHGLRGLRERFRDARYGGWYAAVGPSRPDGTDTPADPRKQAYGHAFVLLAACTAAQAGHDTHDLIQEASDVIAARMLDRPHGLYLEEWDRGWAVCSDYRGQNANMHLAEAFLAAADATGDEGYAGRAARIAERIVGEFAAADGWRVPEHYDSAWRPVPDFNADRPRDLFRPYGTIPGHSLEWARLLIQMHERPGMQGAWMPGAAVDLFGRAVADAWDDQRTGFAYTLGADGAVSVADRFHWVIAEAIGAAAYLHAATGDASYDRWYQRFWDHAAALRPRPHAGKLAARTDPGERPRQRGLAGQAGPLSRAAGHPVRPDRARPGAWRRARHREPPVTRTSAGSPATPASSTGRWRSSDAVGEPGT